MFKSLEHHQIVAAVTVYGYFAFGVAKMLGEPRDARALVDPDLCDFEHHRVEGCINQRIAMLGKICFELAFEPVVRNTAVDLAYLVREHLAHRLGETALPSAAATLTHATHHDASHQTVAAESRLMVLAGARDIRTLWRHAVEAHMGK